MLESHPKLIDYHEIFLKNLHDLRKVATECNAYLTEEGSAHARSFLRKTKDIVPEDIRYEEYWEPTLDFMSHFTDGNQKAVGFKWMMNQGLDELVDEAIEYLNENNYKVIILDRQNLLRQCISTIQLDETHIAHIKTGHEKDLSSKEAYQKLNITANDFSNFFEDYVRYRKLYDEIEANIKPGFITRVTYSELSSDPVSVVKRLHSFFGLDPVEIETGDMVKIHVGPVSDYVEDWENVRAELLKTKYADAVEHWEEDNFYDDMLFIPENHSIQMADDGKATCDLADAIVPVDVSDAL
eukprot:CAMPEP_0197519332 /NCGR_PEP_ID=MMETSP1318-20131121/4590_1 /TAXON_ID=552666 /ORGANISM="Partenskyella glossopodia, Strain RCC365" /LENGTH=296 /DNA_ID=CAMNT_0043070241 /DNA_START=240 /DNA_END=1131 /DNA_ORIENTATION=-